MNNTRLCIRFCQLNMLPSAVTRTGAAAASRHLAVGLQNRQYHDHGGRGSSSTGHGSMIRTGVVGLALGGALYYSTKDKPSGVVHAAARTAPGAKEDFMLYWASGSPFCWRLMIVLEEKGLSGYKEKLLSFSKGDLKLPELGELNPRHQVPSFRHGKIAVNESLAACDYIENTFKKQGTQLLPDERAKQALVLQRKYEALNLYQKGIFDVGFYARSDIADKGEVSKRKLKLATELLFWENYLHQQGPGSYIAGPSFSMADVVFFPALAMMVRMGLVLDRRPNLKAYYERVSQRPSVQASWPPHWKESPPTIFEFSDV